MLTPVELADLRTDLETELSDTVTVRYQDGTTYNAGTYVEEPNLVNRATAVAAHIVPVTGVPAVPDEAGELLVLQTYMVTVPYVTTVEVEDEVVVTGSSDTQLVGTVLAVKDVRVNTIAASRRLRCVLRQTDDPDL